MTEERSREIQGLYSAAHAEGCFWHLIAKVVLGQFAREEKNTKHVTSRNRTSVRWIRGGKS